MVRDIQVLADVIITLRASSYVVTLRVSRDLLIFCLIIWGEGELKLILSGTSIWKSA